MERDAEIPIDVDVDVDVDDDVDPRRLRSRTRLLDAATKLLNAGGIEAVTIDAVTKASKVARTTLYRHFSAIDRHDCERIVDDFLAAHRRPTDRPPSRPSARKSSSGTNRSR